MIKHPRFIITKMDALENGKECLPEWREIAVREIPRKQKMYKYQCMGGGWTALSMTLTEKGLSGEEAQDWADWRGQERHNDTTKKMRIKMTVEDIGKQTRQRLYSQ